MDASFWKGDGEKALTLKAAVSPTGHVVARNYQPDDLRDGDLGLTLRLDRGKLVGLTPEQRLAAQSLAEGMSRELLRALGKEELEGTGFPVGTMVTIGNRVGMIERETKLGLHLVVPDGTGIGAYKVFIPFGKEEILPEEGAMLDAQAKAFHTCYFVTSPRTDRRGFTGWQFIVEFHEKWGDEGLAAFLRILMPAVLYAADQLDNIVERGPEKSVADLMDYISLIRKHELLDGIAEHAKDAQVREAARLVIARLTAVQMNV